MDQIRDKTLVDRESAYYNLNRYTESHQVVDDDYARAQSNLAGFSFMGKQKSDGG